MTMDIQRVLREFTSARTGRGVWDDHWERLARLMHVRRTGFTTTEVDGSRRTEEILDSTPVQARRALSTSVDGLLKPKTVQWSFVKPDDDALENDEEVQDWLRFVEKQMFKKIYEPKARFAQASGEVDDDLVTFGTGILGIDPAEGGSRLSFGSHHLKNAFIQVDAEGNVNGLFLVMWMTAQQAQDFFAKKGVGPGKKAGLALQEEGNNNKIEYVNVILPRTHFVLGQLGPKAMPIASLWIEVAEKELILESGKEEFPFAIPRWDTASGEKYGRSPAMIALPDANTLQAQGRTLLKAGQIAVLPPMFAPSNSIVGQAKLKSGWFTYYDLQAAVGQGIRQPIFPMQTGAGNIPIGREMQNDTRELVWAAFFKNILNLPVNGPQMTATEILERKEEFVRVVGPVFGKLEAEYLAPIIERVFAIMMRNGDFGVFREGLVDQDGQPVRVIPRQIVNRNVNFEFRSPVERVRKQIEAAAAMKTVEEITLVATSTGDPSVLDWIDRDKVAKKIDDANASDILLDRQAVDEIRDQRAQQQAAEAEKVDAERAVAAGSEVAGAIGALEGVAA